MWSQGVSHVGGYQVKKVKITPHLFGESSVCIFQLQEMLATNWGVQDPIENGISPYMKWCKISSINNIY